MSTPEERLAKLEAYREAEIDDREERRNVLDRELENIVNKLDELKNWIRLQLWGNGKKEGCIDYRISTNEERLKKLEAILETWTWRKGALLRIILSICEAIAIIWAVTYFGPK